MKKWLFIGAVLAVALGAALLLPMADWSERLTEAMEHMNFASAFLAFCTVTVVASLLMVPAWIFPLVAGAVFGLGWGLVAAVFSAMLAALAAFLIARYLLRKRFEPLARRNKTFKAVEQAVAKEAWKVVALLRMSPVLPSGMKSYFLGLTRVRLPDYAAASMAGMFPGLALKVYVGAAGRGALAHGGAVDWALFGAGVAATLGLAYLVGRKVRRRLNL